MSEHLAAVILLVAAIIALVLLDKALDEQARRLPIPRPSIADITQP